MKSKHLGFNTLTKTFVLSWFFSRLVILKTKIWSFLKILYQICLCEVGQKLNSRQNWHFLLVSQGNDWCMDLNVATSSQKCHAFRIPKAKDVFKCSNLSSVYLHYLARKSQVKFSSQFCDFWRIFGRMRPLVYIL